VQDLSILHIKFLYHLAGMQVRRLILAGDDQQILHHSGFRWTNINEMFFRQYDIRIPNLQHLEFNYRCSGAITDLAMSINQIQRQYSDVVLKSKPSRSLHQGEKPLLLQGGKEEIASFCDQMGPHQAIIVRTLDQKNVLRDSFLSTFGRTPLIFSITEIKGLEYERIVLWELYPPGLEENEMWEHFQRSIYMGQEHSIKSNHTLRRSLRYETNILYVAVTRGMKHCYIYQGKESAAFWQIAMLPI
jgi:superfamily I DNA/RNA helicase